MIAGRLRWRERGVADPGQGRPGGVRLPRRHAAPHRGGHRSGGLASTSSVAKQDWRRTTRGGLEVLDADLPAFAERLLAREPHAEARPDRSAHLQRHRQRLLRRDPARRAAVADEADVSRCATRTSRASSRPRGGRSASGRERLRRRGRRRRFPRRSRRSARRWPSTAAIGKPCPVCGSPVQRIVYARNESNYCATCQTGAAARGPRPVAAAPRRLAEDARRSRAAGSGLVSGRSALL